MKKSVFLFILLVSSLTCSQEKFEKEYRVKPAQVPENSLNFIKGLNFEKKVKWYVEESNDGKSFEAKICFQKHLFSIEFSEKGNLIDVEKKVSFAELDLEIQNKITHKLSGTYKKYKFKKIQIQYKGLETEVKKVFLESTRNHIATRIFYEIVLKAKKENDYDLYEVLFNENGAIIKELKFKQINSINLEF
ncbi:MAG: hypothetical protein WAO74_10630 [Polaribacter sp.]|uniref:hypothetical protein n=1 Tax=Polaribacter sp. TaxID=1920175 RepID=UPI003BAEC7C8